MKKAVVLLSGGLDSATVLFWAIHAGYQPACLIFDYGQRHRRELNSARRIAKQAEVKIFEVKTSLPWLGSSLLDKSLPIPLGRRNRRDDIPSTYVPARNIIFLSYAASLAEAIGASTILIGANAIDYSGYPDCRPPFIKAFQDVLRRGMKTGVRGQRIVVKAPLLYKTKAQIVRLATKLHVPIKLTWSCYVGGSAPCGRCDSCVLRHKGFEEMGISDPAGK